MTKKNIKFNDDMEQRSEKLAEELLLLCTDKDMAVTFNAVAHLLSEVITYIYRAAPSDEALAAGDDSVNLLIKLINAIQKKEKAKRREQAGNA